MPLLPLYCKETREQHTDRSFCQHCGHAELSSSLSVSAAIQPMAGTVRNNPVEILDSPIPATVAHLLQSAYCVAQAAKDLTGRKQSSRESIKGGFNAGAPSLSMRTTGKSQTEQSSYKFAVQLIFQELVYHNGKERSPSNRDREKCGK